MRYRPQIKIDNYYYSQGKEYMSKSCIEYIGYYHILNNKVYSGNVHDDNSIELISYNNDTNFKNYISLNNSKNIYSYKNPIPTIPTDIDYEKSEYIKRYFIKKRNDNSAKIIEIDSNQYESIGTKIDNSYYYGISINWKIKGYKYDVYKNGMILSEGVYDYNKREIVKYTPYFNGLDTYLTNYLEFTQLT